MLDVDHNIALAAPAALRPLIHEQLGTARIHRGGVRFGIGAFNTEAQSITR